MAASHMRKQNNVNELLSLLSNEKQTTSYSSSQNTIQLTNIKGHTSQIVMDDHGYIGSIISPSGKRYIFENKSDGKLKSFTNEYNSKIVFNYTNDGDIESIVRDNFILFSIEYKDKMKGYPVSITFPNNENVKCQFKYYENSQKIKEFIDSRNFSQLFEYDQYHNLISITDENVNKTRFYYSNWSYPEKIKYANGDTELYDYNSQGYLTRLRCNSRTIYQIGYNESNQPAEIFFDDGNHLNFYYDQSGHIVEATNNFTFVSYKYNAKGFLYSEKQDDFAVEYKYDTLDNIERIVYPTGIVIEYEYDLDTRISLIKISDKTRQHQVRFNNIKDKIIYPNGIVTSIHKNKYDLIGQITTVCPTVSGSLFSFNYKYNDYNHVESFEDSYYDKRVYTYDTENQIIQVDSFNEEAVESFHYDPAGNRDFSSGTRASYNELNQLKQDGKYSCEYDVRGNLIEVVSSDEQWKYSFNDQNLLTSATSSKGTSISYKYDALGRRIWKSVADKEIRFIWMGEKLISELTYQNGEIITQQDYIYTVERNFGFSSLGFPQNTSTGSEKFQINQYIPLATIINGEIYFYHNDRMGTPRRLTDQTGNIVWRADYLTYGEIRIDKQIIKNPIRYPGQYHDEETGLYYNRFRYYSPIFGRYISRDPISYYGGLNFYLYAQNNPINEIDLVGLLWSSIKKAFSAAKDFAVTAWNKAKDICLKCILLELVHTTLDILGLFPGIGEIADGLNALIYLAEGNYIDAGLSAAAMIPFAGWGATAAKYVRKAAKYSPKLMKAVKYGVKLLSKGRKVLKLTKKLATKLAVKGAKLLRKGQKVLKLTKKIASKLAAKGAKLLKKGQKSLKLTKKKGNEWDKTC